MQSKNRMFHGRIVPVRVRASRIIEGESRNKIVLEVFSDQSAKAVALRYGTSTSYISTRILVPYILRPTEIPDPHQLYSITQPEGA